MCTVLTRETGGTYHVILDESHFKELLMLHVKPPPASSSSECSLIRMGEFRYTLPQQGPQSRQQMWSIAQNREEKRIG